MNPRACRDASTRAAARMAVRVAGVQAYDALCFPGLAAERGAIACSSACWDFIGIDRRGRDEVASWIAADTPPIYFGFWQHADRDPWPTGSPSVWLCAELGERAAISQPNSAMRPESRVDLAKVVRCQPRGGLFPPATWSFNVVREHTVRPG